MDLKYTVHYVLGTYEGDVTVYADDETEREQVIAEAQRILRQRAGAFPTGLYARSWRITEVEEVAEENPKKKRSRTKKPTAAELEVLASLEAARVDFWDLPEDEQTRQYFASDGADYRAATSLVKKGLADLQAAGSQDGEEWVRVSLSDEGARAILRRNPAGVTGTSGTIVVAARMGGAPVRISVEGAKLVGDVFVVHPSLRTSSELMAAARKKPSSWGLTHLPTGQLVATVHSKAWAEKLAKEISRFADEGISSSDVRVASHAMAGQNNEGIAYIAKVQRRSQRGKKHKEFPTFARFLAGRKKSRAPNPPHDVAMDAALAAAVGSLLGSLVGAVGGAAALGVVGGTIGGLVGGSSGIGGGALAGAIFGIPLGGFVGTIWGAVRQTRKELEEKGYDPRSAKILAGVGAGIAGPLSPLGAGVGAYLGAMD